MDCNNFYASCERLFRPDLEGRPIVVLSNNDGCIVARSAEAKALGAPMGEPEYKARPLLRRHNVAVFSSNYALYGDISSRVMSVAESVVPQVEVYSIDEAFLRLDGALAANAAELAATLVERVRAWVGIAVSVGVAPTRTLAKLANRIAKKNGIGVFVFPQEPAQRNALLTATPAGDIWGIGPRQAARLASRGQTTALALRDMDDVQVRSLLTVTGWRTAMELRGIPCIDQDAAPVPRRTLVSSRSFACKVTEKSELAEALSAYTVRAAERLRKEDLLAGGLLVHVRTSCHGCEAFVEANVAVNFAEPTADTTTLIKAALRGLEGAFRPGTPYAKAGVMLTDLCPRKGRQGSLLALGNEEERQSRERLMAALDAVNGRFGRHSLRYAAEGPLQTETVQARWHMRREHCSPRATTSWAELPIVFCK